MKILFFLIPLSLILLGLALWGFFWMVRHQQFDNLEDEGWRVLSDDPPKQGKVHE